MRGHGAVLGKTAMPHLTDQPAAADPVDRIDQDAVANRPVAHPRPERSDVAGEVDAHDAGHRHLDPRHAAAREDVMVVQARGPHTYENLTGCRPGFREILHRSGSSRDRRARR